MKTIRQNVFETNSSSTHSICICTDEELKAWKNNEVLYDDFEQVFVTKEQVLEEIKLKNSDLTDNEILDLFEEEYWDYPKSYENWGKDYEFGKDSYITKSGDKINILYYYGYDY